MLRVTNFTEFEELVGKEVGISQWHQITQEQINQFAAATLDHQWIHTDPAKAAAESPFKATIAHGYLTLSLIPYLWKQIISIENLKMEINYGVEELRFSQAVVVDSEVRLKVTLADLINLRGVAKATFKTVLEIKGEKKPAYSGQIIFLYHFNN